MASTSLSPNSPPSSLPPPPATTSQPNQTAGTPPPANPSTPAPPPQSSPAGAPPPAPALLPPVTATPPVAPILSPPPPPNPLENSPPPPNTPDNSPPPPNPPENSSPPPNPPENSPPPPNQPENSPPTPNPPENSPPPPNPPENSPPPPNLPENSHPPPNPPENSSPPPNPPENTTPPPNPPENSPPSQRLTPPPASTSPPPPLLAPPGSQLPPSSPNKPTERSTNGTETATSGGSSGWSKSGGVLAIGLAVGFVVIGFLVMVVWYRRRQKKRRVPNLGYIMPSPFASSQNSESFFLRSQKPSTSPPRSNFIYSPEHGNNSRAWFTFEELARATNGFSGSNLLGEGGFGCVYKGVLEDGREVAVKQLKIGGGQGEREFRAEVEIISRVHHRHLVSLVGYCIHEHQRLLVYQYVPNDTLHYHLHGEGRPVMDWATRIKVAAGAARGLAYLHEDCHPRIIHRDIKSSNILLDDNFDAQVADFGLAKLAMDTDTHVTTRVMGTFGYMAPEYASSGKLTEKSDVFSFGVLLLELITGRKPVDASQPLGDESLVEWARPLLIQALDNQQFEELVDPRLGENYVRAEMFRMIEAAAACIRHLAPKRPQMSQVVRALDSIVEFTTDLSNGMRPGQSEVFDSREQSAQIRLFQRMAFGSHDFSSEYYNNSQSSWRS